jgi:large repetitive protein
MFGVPRPTSGIGSGFSQEEVFMTAIPVIDPLGGADNVVSSLPGDSVVTGTAEIGSTVALVFGGTPLGSATVDMSGNWAYALTGLDITAIGQGTAKTITATATAAGVPSGPTTSAIFALDTLAPFTTINPLGGADTVVSSQPGDALVTGTTEIGSTVALAFGATPLGSATIDGSGNWSYTLTGPNLNAIGQGAGKTITATGSDAAGNPSSVPSASFNVDSLAPVITAVTASPSDAILGAGALVTLTLGLDEPVTVDTAGGTPSLTLNNGGTASYVSGSGTAALAFSYTVAPGQDISDLTVTGGNLNGATATDQAGNAVDLSGTAVNPPGTLEIQPASIAAFDTTTNQPVGVVGQAYTGPVADLQSEYINITPNNLNVSTATPNWFIHSGSGDDAIAVNSGTNVLDGGIGSNFLTGGSGTDTFFVDNRNATADTWSTVVNFQVGDAVTIWGVTPSDFSFDFQDNQGATGFTGLTLHATAPGMPITSVTFAGFTTADLSNGRISKSSGTETVSGSTYTYFHANT